MHNLGDLRDSVNFMSSNITSSAITLTWSPPIALVPMNYEITRQCNRICELLINVERDEAVTSPHYSTGITPYTQCNFSLIGVYGAEIANLITNYMEDTLFNGEVPKVNIVLYYIFIQLLPYQLVILLSHQWSQCQ